jgi:hypothetical protein
LGISCGYLWIKLFSFSSLKELNSFPTYKTQLLKEGFILVDLRFY